MVARSVTNAIYRYGFNGKEHQDEQVGGDYDYGMRIYDSRICRFLSVDPLTPKYPWFTPYQFASNSPIWYIDLDGLEGVSATNVKVTQLGANHIQITADVEIKIKVLNLSESANYQIDFSRLNSIGTEISTSLSTQTNGVHPAFGITKPDGSKPVTFPKVTYKFNVKTTFVEVNSMDQIQDNDFVIVVVDKLDDTFKDKFGNTHSTGAHVVGGTVAFIPTSYLTSLSKSSSQKTTKHELFHILGLDDIEDASKSGNLMYHLGGGGGNSLTSEQIAESLSSLFGSAPLDKNKTTYTTGNKNTRKTIVDELKKMIYTYNKGKASTAKARQ